jgi:Tfp pilus assembly protein FimT
VRSRRAVTLPDLMLTLAVASIVAAMAVRGASRLADGLAARAGARELRAALWSTRHLAVLRATRAALRVDTTRGRIVVQLPAETSLVRDLRGLYGTRLSVSRDSLAYGADGLGWGAANARLVVRRGAAAETITVSRLGRVR